MAFSGFVLVICSIWSIFEKFKYSYRKRLFVIFILSSFPAIILQLPSLQTDLIVGGLVICAFALYLDKSFFFSSLAIALAMGTKSTGVICALSFIILIILYEKLIEKRKDFKNIKNFFVFLTINFLIFSSYNYILNFIQFHHPLLIL